MLIITQQNDVNALLTPASTLPPSYATYLRGFIRVGEISQKLVGAAVISWFSMFVIGQHDELNR